MASHSVTLTDVLDPLTQDRLDVDLVLADQPPIASTIDGSDLWVLPGLYDADVHLPLLTHGIRPLDRIRALHGGAVQVNSALPWHLIRDLRLADITSFLATTSFPRVHPILSVSDNPSSEGFASWLRQNAEEIRSTWMPVIKLYSNDPHFTRNLEAIWEAGCTAAIYFYEAETFEEIATTEGGPVHFRHATSAEMVAMIKARPQSTCQTSPHFLLPLPEGRSPELHVLPPVPGEPSLSSLAGALIADVDVIASDHNAPILGNTGPGLEIDQHFLPALLTACLTQDLNLGKIVEKVTSGPLNVFKPETDAITEGRLIIDPRVGEKVSPWPGQERRRAAFADMELSGKVVAVTFGERAVFM